MAAENARGASVQRDTCKKRLASWTRWIKFLTSIEFQSDEFLNNFDQIDITKLLACFAQSVREAEYSSASYNQLAAGTVRTTVDHVATTFRINLLPDPRLDPDGKPSCLLQRLYAGYS